MYASPPLALSARLPPFEAAVELDSSLVLGGSPAEPTLARRAKLTALPASDSIKITQSAHLPGQPLISLTSSVDISKHVEKELLTKKLNNFAPHLWLVATQNSSHISSLHKQIVRGRHIVVAEDPELHLVWAYDRVYVKPIPKWMLSHAFWVAYICGHEELEKAAKGYLRSWYYLVRHKSDFTIAKENKLVPKGERYGAFMRFLEAFGRIQDDEVAQRYHFGDLRLTRLNFYGKFLLGEWTFFKLYGQYGPYFARFYGPLLFVFGVFSVVLSAMQVGLAVQQGRVTGSWAVFAGTSKWVVILTLVVVVTVALFLALLWCAMLCREAGYAGKDMWRKRRKRRLRVNGV
ncbi:MAG: hypothetical protein M1840_003605 [Geoglossum simile]|nr:MAG: hypothetical protein M1840_003605 [Geoglossum simile]